MLTNDAFKLSEEQLATYNAWAEKMAAAHAEADALCGYGIEITFSFSPLGREVHACVPGAEAGSPHYLRLE